MKFEVAIANTIAEAQNWVGSTAPNPPVGAAALDENGQILSVQAHHRAGEPHAEIHVIEECRRKGTLGEIRTLVVTLEPCNRQGKTGPCTEAILKIPGIKRVAFGSKDPNPKMAGGADFLNSHGIETQYLNDPRCDELIRSFAHWVRTGRPWVVVKTALDARGSMIPPKGQKTFTSPESLKFAHELRKRSDAIITGSGTVLADRPEFSVRHVADFPGKERILAVLDRRKRVDQAWLDSKKSAFLPVIWEDSLDSLLDHLGAQGVLEALVEAGPSLSAAFLNSGLWDEHVVIRSGNPDRVERVLKES